jgi:hypothetical protein
VKSRAVRAKWQGAGDDASIDRLTRVVDWKKVRTGLARFDEGNQSSFL